MSYIHRYFIRMLTFLTLMSGVIIMLHQPLLAAFKNNIPLNTAILMTLSLGIGLVFYRLYGLRQEQLWFEGYERGEERYPGIPAPKILLPLSLSFGEGQQKNQLSTTALIPIRSIRYHTVPH